jgi:hypothetical protein
MRIYEHCRTKGYEMLNFADEVSLDQMNLLNGKPRTKSWKPLQVQRMRATRREGCRPSDSPFVFATGVMVFRRSAVDALRDILDAHGELLPLQDSEGVELYAYNPWPLDALDHDLTQGSRNEEGRVYLPNNHVFIPSIVKGVDIFRLNEDYPGAIYVGENFLQRWKQAKLKGLDFKLAWDSELPPDQQPNIWTSKPIKL